MKRVMTLEAFFLFAAHMEDEYKNGLVTKGECITQLEEYLADLKMCDLGRASEIAAEYKMKLVPSNWEQKVSE